MGRLPRNIPGVRRASGRQATPARRRPGATDDHPDHLPEFLPHLTFTFSRFYCYCCLFSLSFGRNFSAPSPAAFHRLSLLTKCKFITFHSLSVFLFLLGFALHHLRTHLKLEDTRTFSSLVSCPSLCVLFLVPLSPPSSLLATLTG